MRPLSPNMMIIPETRLLCKPLSAKKLLCFLEVLPHFVTVYSFTSPAVYAMLRMLCRLTRPALRRTRRV